MLDEGAALDAGMGGEYVQAAKAGVALAVSVHSRLLLAMALGGCLLTGRWRWPPAVAACCSWRLCEGGRHRRLWRLALLAAAWG